MSTHTGIGVNTAKGGGQSWSSYCKPLNVVVAPITGGNRITFTQQCPLTHTRVYASVDSGDYSLITTLLPGVETYDHIIAGPVIVDYKLQAILITLGIPQNLTSEIITGTGIRLTWDDNSDGDTTHIEIWSNVDDAGYSLVDTIAVGTEAYDYGIDDANVKVKVRAKMASPVAYSDYSNEVEEDVPSFYDADALALFARMAALSEEPNGTRKDLINTAFTVGKTKAFWDKMLAIWMPAAHAANSAKLNWLSTDFTLSYNGTPTFTVDQGLTTTSGSNYILTGLNLSTGGGTKYVLNSASLGILNRSETNGTGAFIGRTSATNSYIQKYTDNNIYSALNSSTYVTVSSPGNIAKKLLVTTRNDATNIDVYVDTTKTTQAKASVSLPNVELQIGYLASGQYSFFFAGAGLTATDIADIKSVFVSGFLTSIGALP